jgi:uncharacterized protein (TIGR02145 family)
VYLENQTITTPITGTLKCPEKTYKTVVLGTQVWMAEHLDYGTQVNGAKLIENQSNDAVVEKYCHSEVADNCTTDGALYQWAEAMNLPSECNTKSCKSSIKVNHQGICPDGWHIPTSTDYSTLIAAYGGNMEAGAKMKMANTGFPLWENPPASNKNPTGFDAFPAGYRGGSDPIVGYLGVRGSAVYLWTATENTILPNWAGMPYFAGGSAYFLSMDQNKAYGVSVRCLKNP